MINDDLLWQPSDEQVANSQLTRFQCKVNSQFNLSLKSYADLHEWSVHNIAAFWEQVWQFCDVKASQHYSVPVVDENKFPGAQWFPDSQLNFAENLLRYDDNKIALVGLLENGARKVYTYAELHNEVGRLAFSLREQGIKSGDRIAGFMPNICETVVAMLATTSLGAIWTSCSPDFGVNGACERFGQIQPRLLFCCEAYCYNGKQIDCLEKMKDIQKRVSSIEKTIVVPVLTSHYSSDDLVNSVAYSDFLHAESSELVFEQLPFDHPVYINYSSGTTGAPKCIMHGSGGTLLQHLKEHQLHTNITRDDVLFYFTTCGWMMWNWLVSGLASGCTLVLFDGSPFANDGSVLLDAIDNEKITVFGTSAKYIASLEKSGHLPRQSHQLSSLKTILSTGSPLSTNSYEYIYRDIKEDVCVSSICGGTDIISCFVLGNPNLSVYRGEIQCIGLGMAVEIWDDNGHSLVGQKGELVCTKPFPSTPLGFWDDNDNIKFHAAYFNEHKNIWSHGDFGEITRHRGMIIHGRSDAVLNPGGVRIGTAEIYRQVEKIDQVLDSVVVGQEFFDDIRVILFVVLDNDFTLDQDLINTIKQLIRVNTTVRHVPAKVIQVADIPRTLSGKIVELAVKNVIHNRQIKNVDALANPEALAFFKNLDELKY